MPRETIILEDDIASREIKIKAEPGTCVIIMKMDPISGDVKIASWPEPQVIAKRIKEGHHTTPAEDYCLLARDILRRVSGKIDSRKIVSNIIT
jgi:hypothetical protein